MEIERKLDGDRALLVYLFGTQEETTENDLVNAINDAMTGKNVAEYEFAGVMAQNINGAAEVVLSDGDEPPWLRPLRVGFCRGLLRVALAFYKQPPAPEDDEGVVCDIVGALCDAIGGDFPGALYGASAFVIKPNQRRFFVTINEAAQ